MNRSRSKARKAALDVLYSADLRGSTARPEEIDWMDREHREYTDALLTGIKEHADQIDSLIHTYAEGWDKDRLPAIDRNILRIAIFEILWGDMDHVVAISEAVSLAERLSTSQSAKFVNGLLARISGIADTLPR